MPTCNDALRSWGSKSSSIEKCLFRVEEKLIRNWLVHDRTGLYALTSGYALNEPIHATFCGLNATDADGVDMKSALSDIAKLGPPIKTAEISGGGSSVTWSTTLGGQKVEILLAYGNPGVSGVLLNLIYRQPSP
jgi:hypothetical protein